MAQFHGTGGKLSFGGKEVGGLGEWRMDTSGDNDLVISESAKEWGKFIDGVVGLGLTVSGTFTGDTTALATALAAALVLERITATVNLPIVGKYHLEGYCNPGHTRVYFASPAHQNKYFLMHLDAESMLLRREKAVYSLGEAQRWVLNG